MKTGLNQTYQETSICEGCEGKKRGFVMQVGFGLEEVDANREILMTAFTNISHRRQAFTKARRQKYLMTGAENGRLDRWTAD
jgi:hypothetical protein